MFRALSDANTFGACQASQLDSMATLSRSVFSCHSSFVKKGNVEKRDRCLTTAEARFARTYQRAIARSAKRSKPCGLDATPALADDIITTPSSDTVTAILGGSTPGADTGADALHAALLRNTGTLLGAFLDIEARRARKGHAATRDVAQARARRRFDGEVRRALTRAMRKGVEYVGPEPSGIAGGANAIAIGATLASSGIAPEDPVNP